MTASLRITALALALAAFAHPVPAACPNGCNDGNACTADSCDAVRGCLHTPIAGTCSDGIACTTGDSCQSGACVGGPAAPGCSRCQAAAVLPPAGGSFTGVTSGTSQLNGTGECGRSTTAPERVYRWTPSVTRRVEIATCGTSTSFDTLVYVRRNSCTASQYACNDDGPCATATTVGDASRILLDVVAGQTYYIVVDGYNGGRGSYALTIGATSTCGDGVRQGTEACDRTDAAACATGLCAPDCTCVPTRCGDGARQGTEACDGTDAAACATGLCASDCTCVQPRCGDGIRQGTEQCDLSDNSACATRECYPNCTCIPPTVGRPDLVPEIVGPFFEMATAVPAGDVAEGCATRTTGVDLFRFGVRVYNLGRTDLFLGDPMCPEPCSDHPNEVCANPLFICAPAGGHGHPHYQNYASYDLLGPDGTIRVSGHKQGFCLHDGFDSGVPCANRHFDSCDYQGLSVGCADLYEATLGCQYVEVTGLAPGPYTLRVTVDPLGQIPEDNEANNVVTIPVTVPDRSCGALPIPPEGGTVPGTTSGPNAFGSTCGFGATGPEKVYRWVPARSGTAVMETCGSGTDYDTFLHVRSGDCLGADIACNDDAPCATANSVDEGSRMSFPVQAGIPYFVFVDGYGGKSGRFTLRVTPP